MSSTNHASFLDRDEQSILSMAPSASIDKRHLGSGMYHEVCGLGKGKGMVSLHHPIEEADLREGTKFSRRELYTILSHLQKHISDVRDCAVNRSCEDAEMQSARALSHAALIACFKLGSGPSNKEDKEDEQHTVQNFPANYKEPKHIPKRKFQRLCMGNNIGQRFDDVSLPGNLGHYRILHPLIREYIRSPLAGRMLEEQLQVIKQILVSLLRRAHAQDICTREAKTLPSNEERQPSIACLWEFHRDILESCAEQATVNMLEKRFTSLQGSAPQPRKTDAADAGFFFFSPESTVRLVAQQPELDARKPNNTTTLYDSYMTPLEGALESISSDTNWPTSYPNYIPGDLGTDILSATTANIRQTCFMESLQEHNEEINEQVRLENEAHGLQRRRAEADHERVLAEKQSHRLPEIEVIGSKGEASTAPIPDNKTAMSRSIRDNNQSQNITSARRTRWWKTGSAASERPRASRASTTSPETPIALAQRVESGDHQPPEEVKTKSWKLKKLQKRTTTAVGTDKKAARASVTKRRLPSISSILSKLPLQNGKGKEKKHKQAGSDGTRLEESQESSGD